MTCRAPYLAAVLAFVDHLPAPEVPPCAEPVAYTVLIRRDGVSLDVDLCNSHDLLVATNTPGYVRSIKRRAT